MILVRSESRERATGTNKKICTYRNLCKVEKIRIRRPTTDSPIARQTKHNTPEMDEVWMQSQYCIHCVYVPESCLLQKCATLGKLFGRHVEITSRCQNSVAPLLSLRIIETPLRYGHVQLAACSHFACCAQWSWDVVFSFIFCLLLNNDNWLS